MRRLAAITISALLLVAGLAIWWSRSAQRAEPPENADASVAQPGGRLTATIRNEPRTFNRFASTDATSDLLSHLMHAKLVRINRATDELEAGLATRWEASSDGLTYTLTLRDDVTFSDGAPFTSADVLFAFEAIYDERSPLAMGGTMRVGGRPLTAAASDATHVTVTFPAPYGPGLRILDSLPILPRHKLEDAYRRGELNKSWGLATPSDQIAGLGPFILRSYSAGRQVVLDRNPRYWRRDESGARLPYLDGVTFDIVPDQNTESLRLEAGQTDLTQSEVRPQDYSAFKRAADAGRLTMIDSGVGLDVDYLWFNLAPSAGSKHGDGRSGRGAAGGAGAASSRPWLVREELRRAISMAVDRQAFADAVYLGAAAPVWGPVTPAAGRWFTKSIAQPPHDVGKARELLGSIGLSDRNGDGLLDDEAGRTARFALLTQKGNSVRERAASVLQADLRGLGVHVDVAALDPGALVDRWQKQDYDAIYFGFLISDPDPSANIEFWSSGGAFHLWNAKQSSPATEWERSIDDVMAQINTTSDAAERQRLFHEVQTIFADHLPALTFAAPHVAVAMNPRVANVTPGVRRPQVLWNSEQIALRKKPG